MGKLRETQRLVLRILFAALTVLGIEIDFISNPFPSDFVLYRVYAFLDVEMQDEVPSETGATEADPVPLAELVSEAGVVFPPDETLAIRPQKNPRGSVHPVSPIAWFRIAPVPASPDRCHHSTPTSRPPGLSLYCRFLC